MNYFDSGFGIYIHWPFCKAKCPYCDFNSHVNRNVDNDIFVNLICKELVYMRNLSGTQNVTSIFFGGGTPSLMSPKNVSDILKQIDKLWGIGDLIEITLEANPTSVEASKFNGYKQAGVNRLSVGVQALNDKDLLSLGRQHTSQEALTAFRIAQKIFPKVSFDLIYARPGQTPNEWEAELKLALLENADHMSLYQLTIEEGTAYYELEKSGKLRIPNESLSAKLFEITQDLTSAFGLRSYEVSNHAKPGHECRHNLIYWRYGEYVGAGPGAHGRISYNGSKFSTHCIRDPKNWLNSVEQFNHGILELEQLTSANQAFEYLIMGMRLSEGISNSRYASLSGKPISQEIISDLVSNGLLYCDGDRVSATVKGRQILNSVISKLAEI